MSATTAAARAAARTARVASRAVSRAAGSAGNRTVESTANRTANRSANRPGLGGDTVSSTGGLTNARTRIVGDRTGPLADGLVAAVRLGRNAWVVVAAVGARIGAVVTALGWFLVVALPVVFAFGYAFAWTELIIAGWAMLVLLGLASLYLIGNTALEIELRMPAPRVVVGQRAVGEIAVRNPRQTRIPGALVGIPVGSGLADVAVPSLRQQGTSVHQFGIPTGSRGVIRIGPVRSIRADPIGLVRRERVWTEVTQVFVHPRTIGIPSMSTGLVHDLEGNATRDLSASDMSFHALREYQSGDERRSIHWKSTAKTGRYMVRQFEETRRSHLLVALSVAEADYASEDEFEMAVSVAGSLGARAIRDTRDVSVVVGETTPEFARRKVFATKSLSTLTRTRLLDDLSGVDLAPSSLGIVDVARVTAEVVFGVSVAFLVCGSTVGTSQLRAASLAFPSGVEVVAICCDPDLVPGARRMAGLTVFTIGELEDLKKSLVRSAAA